MSEKKVVEELLSQRSKRIRRSEIRELLKTSQRPGIISFAGGFPDPFLFPFQTLSQIAAEEILYNARQILQYGTTEGLPRFKEAIIRFFAEFEQQEIRPEEIAVTTASQQALDLIAKVFLDPGDVVICGLPTYLGAIQAFLALEAHLEGISLENDGWDLDYLQKVIKKFKRQGKQIKFFYVIPDWQNPYGIRWSLEKRKEILKIAKENHILIVEDIPYRQLSELEPLPTIRSLDEEKKTVIDLFTLSKILCPGMRLGCVIGTPDMIDQVVKMKQAADLCTSPLVQAIAASYLRHPEFKPHLAQIVKSYEKKRKLMLAILEESLGNIEDVTWTRPSGGMFLMVTLPPEIDTTEMLKVALEEKVAYVPGSSFFVNGKGQNTLRLCWATPSLDEIDKGTRQLAEIIKSTICALSSLSP